MFEIFTAFSSGPLDEAKSRRSSPESAGEMFARWENTSVDAEGVVRDALRAGRVPLAVVQLHRMRSKAYMSGSSENLPEMVDVFQQVQEIGKGIVYELLCKVSFSYQRLYQILTGFRNCNQHFHSHSEHHA